jgi:CubicO group peptidase (beta-lactamase class C family)
MIKNDFPILTNGKAEDYGFDPQKLQLVDEQINADIAAGFPGAGLIIIKDNHIIKHNVYGYKRKYDDNGNLLAEFDSLELNTLFDLASNSKMYAANYAIMRLVFEGKIKLDAPIKTYLPKYIGCDNNGQSRDARKVINLLYHDAGYEADPQFFNPAAIGAEFYSQDSTLTKQLILTQLPFQRPQGGAPLYSDVDFILLGMIVESVTQQSLDQYVENTFYRTLGLNNTVFNPLRKGFKASDCAATEINGNTRGATVSFPNIRTQTIQGEVHDEKAYYSLDGVSGHAGLFSTLADMAVLTQIMLNQGSYAGHQFWNAQVQNEFTLANPFDPSYGLGWRRAGDPTLRALKWFSPYASEQAIGHTGWTGTMTVIDPKYNLAIILLTNKRHSPFVNGRFEDDSLATGNYTQIATLIYRALNSLGD